MIPQREIEKPKALPRPTRARHWVIVFAGALSVITYIDRVCISQAAPNISRELGLSSVQMGYAFSAFAWAYALFEIPGGWLGDSIGPRKVLMRVVVWWSIFTAATGWVWNLSSLLITRFLFGAGEAGCFPNLAKAFTNWLPKAERSRAVGWMWLSARWGGAFTPVLVVWIFSILPWRRAFEVFGVIGVIWAIFFYRWFRDRPQDHPSVNASELALLDGTEGHHETPAVVPWRVLLRSRTVRLLWLQYFCFSYGWYFYITWLPTYLHDARGLTLAKSAWLAGFPLFFGGIGSLTSGWLSVNLARRFGVVTVRRTVAYIAFSGAALMLILSMYVHDPIWAMVSMGLASFSLDLALPMSWGTCIDVGGRFAGTLSGSMNMCGNIAGGVAPIVVGYILDHSHHNWPLTFWISAVIYLLGALCWAGINPLERLEPEPAAAALKVPVRFTD